MQLIFPHNMGQNYLWFLLLPLTLECGPVWVLCSQDGTTCPFTSELGFHPLFPGQRNHSLISIISCFYTISGIPLSATPRRERQKMKSQTRLLGKSIKIEGQYN